MSTTCNIFPGDKMIRVLYLCASGHIGGGNQSFLTLWAGLRCQGIIPIAIIPDKGSMIQACIENGIEYRIMNYNWLSWKRPASRVREVLRWRKMLKEIHPVIVHANDRFAGRSIALALWIARIPMVCHVRFPPPPEAIARSFRGLPKPHIFLFNSFTLQAQVGIFFRRACPNSRQQVVYNGIDLKVFQPVRRYDQGRLRVAIVANLLPVKGHQIFLEMVRELASRGNKAEFWIVGEDPHNTGYRQKLECLAATMSGTSSVRFLGYCHDIPSILSQIDILVSCSHEEPFGRSLAEAMACEVPVVAPSVGGIPEVIEDGKTGLLVPSNNPIMLADAVERLLHDHSLRLAMGKAGRQRVLKLFSSGIHAAEVIKVYRSLLKQ
jgi:glycosyltransferase involved in cell wall biosynthesis